MKVKDGLKHGKNAYSVLFLRNTEFQKYLYEVW